MADCAEVYEHSVYDLRVLIRRPEPSEPCAKCVCGRAVCEVPGGAGLFGQREGRQGTGDSSDKSPAAAAAILH